MSSLAIGQVDQQTDFDRLLMYVQACTIRIENLHRYAPVLFFSKKGAPAWMHRNEDSLLRAAGENALASATRGGSCTHPDQSWILARKALKSDALCVGTSSLILPFFLGGGVALHECLG